MGPRPGDVFRKVVFVVVLKLRFYHLFNLCGISSINIDLDKD